jgi:vacuolar-type H+-ATPase subunit H
VKEVVIFLAIEALRTVRETEASAVELRRAARDEARKILEQAEAEGEALIEREISQAHAEAGAIIAQAEAEATREADPIRAEAKTISACIRQEAAGHLPSAVAHIVERIVKAHGRS